MADEKQKKTVSNLNELILKLDREVEQNAGLGAYEAELAAKNDGQKTDPVLEIAPKKSKVALITPGRIKPAAVG